MRACVHACMHANDSIFDKFEVVACVRPTARARAAPPNRRPNLLQVSCSHDSRSLLTGSYQNRLRLLPLDGATAPYDMEVCLAGPHTVHCFPRQHGCLPYKKRSALCVTQASRTPMARARRGSGGGRPVLAGADGAAAPGGEFSSRILQARHFLDTS